MALKAIIKNGLQASVAFFMMRNIIFIRYKYDLFGGMPILPICGVTSFGLFNFD